MSFSRTLKYGLPLGCIAIAACLPAGTTSRATTATTATTADSSGRPSATAASTPLLQARQSDQLVQMMGINVHLLYGSTPYGDFPKVLRELKTLGVRHIRTDFSPGRKDLAQELSELGAAGIHTDLVMNQTANTSDLNARVAAVAALPAGAVDTVEPANEWNLFGPSNWAAQDQNFQRRLWSLVQAQPRLNNVKVLGPSLGKRIGYTELGNLSPYLDYGNIHLYPGGAEPTNRVDDQLVNEQTVAKSKSIIVTEAGYHNALHCRCTHPPITEHFANVYEPRLFLDYFLQHQVKRVYQYQLYDLAANDPGLTEYHQHFGILRYDGSAKPSFGAMRNLISLTADPGKKFTPGRLAVSVSGSDPVEKVLLQKRDGTFTLFLWRDVSVWDPNAQRAAPVHPDTTTVRFGQSVASATVYQPAASAKPISQVSHPTSLTVPLSGQVVAVRIALH